MSVLPAISEEMHCAITQSKHLDVADYGVKFLKRSIDLYLCQDEKEKAGRLEENVSLMKEKNRLLEGHAEETAKSVQTITMQAMKIKTLEQYALFMDEKAARLEEKNKLLEASAEVTVELVQTIAMQAEKITQPGPINAHSLSQTSRLQCYSHSPFITPTNGLLRPSCRKQQRRRSVNPLTRARGLDSAKR